MADSPTGITFRYAGFWLRAVAAAIDGGVVLLAMWLIGLVFGVNIGALEQSETDLDRISGLWVALVFVAWGYYAVMESTAPQATVGKLLMGIYVTDLGGDRLTFKAASVRYWVKYLSASLLLIGFLMAIITRRKQALHDIVAKSLVLKR